MNENNKSIQIIKSEENLYNGLRVVMFNNDQREGKRDPDFSGWIENIDQNLINEGLKKLIKFVFWKKDIKHYNGIFSRDFKTVLNIAQALNGGNNTPSIKGTILLMDGHTYNLALWFTEATENKKSYYNGKLEIQKNNIFIVDQNII